MKFATILTFSATAHGLAFDGPLPTPVTDVVYAALNGFSPKPTNGVRALPDLFRRQKAASNPAVCGFLDGDGEFPISCTASSTCLYSSSANWFGCCASESCSAVTRCINSASVSSCLDDESCFNDPGAIACSATDAPFCVNMFAGSMSHWICGARATSVAVLASASTTGSASTTDSVSVTKDAGRIIQGGVQSTASLSGVKSAASLGANSAAASPASSPAASPVSSPASTGGGAIQTAGAMVGVVMGAFAVFL